MALLGELTNNTGWVKTSIAIADAKKEVISESILRKAAKKIGLENATIRQGHKGAYAIWYDTKKVPENIIEQLTLEAARA